MPSVEEQIATLQQALTQERHLRQQAEAALQESLRTSDQRYTTLVQAVPVGIFRTDPDGHCLYVNDRWCQITGLTAIEAQQDGWAKTLHPDDRDRIVAKWYACAQHNLPFHAEYRFQHPNGTITWVVGEAIEERGIDGKHLGYIGSITDISEAKRAEGVRTQAEFDLKQSEQKFRAIFDGTFQFIGLLTPEGRVTEANRTALDAIGITLASVAGKFFWATPWWTHSPTLQEQLKAAIARAATGELARFEAEHILADGKSIFVDFSLTPVLDEAGNVIMLIPEGRDISDRKKADLQLQQREEFLRSIYHGTEQAVFVVDVTDRGDFSYVGFNPVSERYASVSNDQIQGKTPEEAFGPEMGTTIRQNYTRCLQMGTSIKYEEQLVFKAHTIWTLTTLAPLRNQQGQIYRIVGTATDISDRKHKEEVLRNLSLGVSTKTNRVLFQALAEYLTKTLGVDYAIISELIQPENLRVRTIAGYGDGRVLDNFEYDLVHTPCENVAGRKLCVYPSRIQQQFPLDRFLQEIQAESFIGVPLFDSTGRAVGVIAILSRQPWLETQLMTEILTIFAARAAAELERQQAEAELERQKQDLARSNAELQQFAYVASHDLQEPLRMVTSYLELLERRYKGQLDPKADQFIAYAVDGAVRMQTLINALLSYSRIGAREQLFVPVNCAEVLQDVLTNLQVTIAQNKALITHDRLPFVSGDRTQLTQLFQNIINNGIKFRRVERPHIHLGVMRLSDKWLFSIRDNGIGIETQYIDRIFVIFQRLHSRSEYPGTGIGLAICKKIVERHGGKLWVESKAESQTEAELEQGSVFHFTLPVTAQ
jgi:PAS domain S-box-containing protein